jgi:hypothetical protein
MLALLVPILLQLAKEGLSLVDLFNHPAIVAARQQEEEQRQRDLDAQAVTKAIAGDPTMLEERSS